MIGHSHARDEPKLSRISSILTAYVLTASMWASWYQSIGKACILLMS